MGIGGWYYLNIKSTRSAGATKGNIMTTAKNTDKTEAEVTEGNTMTPKELAAVLNTDPKTIRKFLRSLSSERPGKGGRWAINRSDLDAITARFADWNSTKVTTLALTDDED